MKVIQMRITVIVFGCWFLGLCGAFTLQSIAGLRGQSVVLPCTLSLNQSTGKWTLLSRSSGHGTPERTLWNGNDVSNPSKYKVGRYDLTVDRLHADDAGTYKCVLLKNGNSRAITTEEISNVVLTVIDSTPICGANFTPSTQLREGDIIRVACNVSYLGRAVPVTHCDRTQSNEYLSTNTSSDTVVVNTVTIKVEIDLNDQMLNCSTYFQIHESNVTTNNRSYRHSWLTSRLNVVYKPRNLRLDPDAAFYDLGSTVRCVADANPPPTLFEWHNTGNGQLIKGDQLVIDTPVFSPGTFKYRCTVKNDIDISNSTFTLTVTGGKNGTTMTGYAIALPVLIVILALVTTTVVLVTKNRAIRKKLKMQEEMMAGTAELQLTDNEPLSDYDEIIYDSPNAHQGTTTNPHQTDVQVDIYNEGSEVILPKETNLSYTGLTGPRHVPTSSAYTPLGNSGQPPSPPPHDDNTTTSTTSNSGARDETSLVSVQPKSGDTPKYVNQPLYIEAIAEEA